MTAHAVIYRRYTLPFPFLAIVALAAYRRELPGAWSGRITGDDAQVLKAITSWVVALCRATELTPL